MKKDKVKYAIVDLSNFSQGFNYDDGLSLSNKLPYLCYNFSTDNDELTVSYGLSEFEFRTATLGMSNYKSTFNGIYKAIFLIRNATSDMMSRRYLIVLRSDDSSVYCIKLDNSSPNFNRLGALDQNYKANFIVVQYNYINYLLISSFQSRASTTSKLYVCDGLELTKISDDIPPISDVVIHDETLFLIKLDVTYCNTIYYGADANPLNIPSNIDRMMSFEIPMGVGAVQRLISFGDYLYIFCEYGIYRVLGFNKSGKFELEQVYVGTSKIVKDSIVVGGGSLYFATKTGIYVFNGTKVSKLDLKIYDIFSEFNDYSKACFVDDKYYLTCRINYQDGIAENIYYSEHQWHGNAILVYDTISEKVDICGGIRAKEIMAIQDVSGSEVFAVGGCTTDGFRFNGPVLVKKTGKYDEDKNCVKIWHSALIDCDDATKDKAIKSVMIKTAEEITLTVGCDDKEYEYIVDGKDCEQTIMINKKCRVFYIKIKSITDAPKISGLKARVAIYG